MSPFDHLLAASFVRASDYFGVIVYVLLVLLALMIGIAPVFCWYHLSMIHKLLKSHLAEHTSRPAHAVQPMSHVASVPPVRHDPEMPEPSAMRWRVIGKAFDGRRAACKVMAGSADEAQTLAGKQLAEVHHVEPATE